MEKCNTPHLTEATLQEAFVKIFNELVENREELINFIEETILKVCDISELDKKLCIAKAETNTKLEAVNGYVKLNSRTAILQNEYNETFNNLMSEYETTQEKEQQLEKEKNEAYIRNQKCKDFIGKLKQNTILQTFDEELFNSMVEKISVFEDKLIFEFKDGTEREYML